MTLLGLEILSSHVLLSFQPLWSPCPQCTMFCHSSVRHLSQPLPLSLSFDFCNPWTSSTSSCLTLRPVPMGKPPLCTGVSKMGSPAPHLAWISVGIQGSGSSSDAVWPRQSRPGPAVPSLQAALQLLNAAGQLRRPERSAAGPA